MNTMTNIQNAPIPEYLVQIVSNSAETLEKYGMEALFDKYPQWFKNAIDNYKIKIHVIETEIFFKIVNLNGQEVNVFVNDCIGKSNEEGEVYAWFYEGLNERNNLDYGLDNLIITKKED